MKDNGPSAVLLHPVADARRPVDRCAAAPERARKRAGGVADDVLDERGARAGA